MEETETNILKKKCFKAKSTGGGKRGRGRKLAGLSAWVTGRKVSHGLTLEIQAEEKNKQRCLAR